MLGFAVIGLICNSLGCYWVDVPDATNGIYVEQAACSDAVRQLKNERSVEYFDFACRAQYLPK